MRRTASGVSLVAPAARIVLLLALAAPRVLRLAYPQIWIEDDWYINGAWMMSRGFLPYRDFPLPHLPALELAVAALFSVVPATLRAAEIVTQCAAYAGSWLVFLIGRRLGDGFSGAAAAVIFATSALLFRYHLFEREVFVVVPVMAAVLLVSAPASRLPSSARTTLVAMSTGALLALALAIKLSALAALVGVGLQLLFQRRRRCAALVVGTALGLAGLAAIVLFVAFRADFIVQVILFRAVHATFPSLLVKFDEMRLTTDIAFALGMAGAIFIVWSRQAHRFAAPLFQLGCAFFFLLLLNPTYWAHTGIELLPWLSLCGGCLIAAVGRALVPRSWLGHASHALATRTKAIVCSGVCASLLLLVSPIPNLNWQAGDGSPYGLGYRDRSEIERVAAYVREHTKSDEVVATPPIIAFATNRREIIPYPEIAGTIEDLTASVRQRGYIATWADAARYASFWDSVEASRVRVAAHVAASVAQHVPAVVINDPPNDVMPVQFVNLSPEMLRANGYRFESVTTHYEIWLRR